jgi:hypothetical protein
VDEQADFFLKEVSHGSAENNMAVSEELGVSVVGNNVITERSTSSFSQLPN